MCPKGQHELLHQLINPDKKRFIRWRLKRGLAFKDGACVMTS